MVTVSQLKNIQAHGCGKGAGNIPSSVPGPLPASANVSSQFTVISYWKAVMGLFMLPPSGRAFANSPLLKKSAHKFQVIKKHFGPLSLQDAGYNALSLAVITGEIGRPAEGCHAIIKNRHNYILQ